MKTDKELIKEIMWYLYTEFSIEQTESVRDIVTAIVQGYIVE